MGEIVEFANIIDWLEEDLYLIFISLGWVVSFWGLKRENQIKIYRLY